MSFTVIAVIVGIAVIAIVLLLALLLMGGNSSRGGSHGAVSNNLKNLVMSQRDLRKDAVRQGHSPKSVAGANLALAAAAEGDQRKPVTSKIDLEKKLKYAKWPITPFQFRCTQAFGTLMAAVPAYQFATIWIFLMVVVMTPLLIGSALDKAVDKRFEMFDLDYPVLLLSYVSLLKTGMSAIQGLESAAKGLEEDSLVRLEVELLVERLRMGMTEEQAISAFGEDIAHPELELFVQSLILSKRVGGTLSATLERLAKQVRKRQQFRKQAVAAVGMERSSLHMIAFVMGLLMIYLTWTAPDLVVPAFSHPLGKKIFQFGIMVIVFGFYWSRKVTEIKI
jgi:tight adherence protein B